jgi:uncharacterized protein (TIGR00255 family)
MTGYGVADGPAGGGRLQVEIRTVNHRHFTANLKLCTPLQSLEVAVRDRLRERIARGHVTVTARWIEEPQRQANVQVNLERAREVVQALSNLKRELDLPGEIDLGFVARQPDVFTVGASAEPCADEADVTAVVDTALAAVVTMREREGEALGQDLGSLLAGLEDELRMVEDRAPHRLTLERDRLQRSVGELLNGRALDQDRLGQEIAIIADRLDITEEIVRLKTHLVACRESLNGDGPVGRQLTFLGQEVLREVNTVGSKANDAPIGQAVIVMKGAIEKFREQVENIE